MLGTSGGNKSHVPIENTSNASSTKQQCLLV